MVRLRAWLFRHPWCQGAFRLAECRLAAFTHIYSWENSFPHFPSWSPSTRLFNGTVCQGGVPAPVPV